MKPRRILEVPMPEGVDPTVDDAELLKAVFQALTALRVAQGRDWLAKVRTLEEDGWTVRWGLAWRAEVKRGEEYEEATGATLDEALDTVSQTVAAEFAGHVP
ncbi:MAG: hypothetical protein U0529_02590 [Thermoanaerobaculia bacterium]